jgi:coenzyme Q-binding protein COQ10
MPTLTQTKTLPYSAKKMYDLVMDIEKYPEFLPWCKQAKIVEKISEENLRADLLINFKSLFEKYRSDVKHGNPASGHYFIDVVAIEGPFKKLVNQWQFRDLENGECEVKFFIEFEFNSIFLTKILSPIFEKAAEKMMAAFEERAGKI